MKKRIFALLLSALLLSTATACNQTPGNNEESSVESSAEESSVEESTDDAEPDFEYVENEDGGITLQIYLGKENNVVVPSEVNGKPVTKIGSHCFANGFDLLSVTLPETITVIGSSAFFQCSSLSQIILPSNLERIEHRAFEKCTALANISLPNTLSYIGSCAFANCTSLKQIHLPSKSVSEKSVEAFAASGLETVTLAEGITVIPVSMFWGTDIKEVILPSTVKKIDIQAFCGCEELKTVILNKGLQVIDMSAFEDCTSLTEMVIPETVTSMSESAFFGCDNLKSVKFEGNAPQDFVFTISFIEFERLPYTIYYHQGAEGFTSPEWCGYHTEIW